MADGFIVDVLVNCSRAFGAASLGFVQRGAGPLFHQWASAGRTRLAVRALAASLHDCVILVALEPAAPGGVDGGERFEGTGERASPRRCLELVVKGVTDAGVGLAARPR